MSSTTFSPATSPVMASHNKAALDYFIHLPVSREMVRYLVRKAGEVISCEKTSSHAALPPTPPDTPPSGPVDSRIPSVEAFIINLVQQSHVQVPTLMTSLVYLARLRSRLPPQAQGMRCSVHRIFLASLILAAKNLNDSSPKNKHWARYTWVPGYDSFGFSTSEVNLMEKQLLYLLDWDMRVTEEDLYCHFEHFLGPIRSYQARQAEQRAAAAIAAEKQIRQPSYSAYPVSSKSSLSSATLVDSPSSTSSASSHDLRSLQSRAMPPARSISRMPSRLPSLSPPSRSDSASSDYSESEDAPPSPMLVETCDQVQVLDTEMPSLIQIEPAKKQQRTLPFEIEKPSKRSKSNGGNIFSRLLGSTGIYPRMPQHTTAVTTATSTAY